MTKSEKTKEDLLADSQKTTFCDIFNLSEVQHLQDLFADAHGVASVITDTDGKPITQPSNFTRLCEKIIRGTEKGCANCFHSDAIIGRYNPAGVIVQPCLSGGLWDAGASITVGGNHVANWLIGQVRNEQIDEQHMMEYANEIGADKADFKAALDEVPVMSAKAFHKIADFLFVLANELSEKAFSNTQLNKQIDEANKATSALKYAERRMTDLIHSTDGIVWEADAQTFGFTYVSQQAERILGYKIEEWYTEGFWANHIFKNDRSFAVEFCVSMTQQLLPHDFEYRFLAKDGRIIWLRDIVNVLVEEGKPRWLRGLMIDITRRKLDEEAVRQNEAIQRKMVSSIGDVIVVIDHDGINRYKSPNIASLFGWRPEELVGQSTWDVVHPDDLERAQQFLGAIANEPNTTGTTEIRYKRKDGSYVWIEITLVNLLNDPDIEGLLGNYHDITERKQLENVHNFLITAGYPGSDKNFFESLAKYLAEILDSEYVCIDELEGDGLTAQTVAIYNEGKFDPNLRYTLKQTPCGEVAGKTICCFPENVCQLFPHDEALLELKAHSYIGTTLWSFEGKPIGLIAVIGQKPLKNIAFAQNVLKLVAIRAAGELERLQVEKTLIKSKQITEESEEKYRLLVNYSGDPIFVFNQDESYRFVNESFASAFGKTPDEIIGQTPHSIFTYEEAEKRLTLVRNVFKTGEKQEIEVKVDTAAGVEKYFLTMADPIKDLRGKTLWVSCISKDITERKHAEKLLINAKDAAEEIQINIQSIIENTADSIWSVNSEFKLTYVNQMFRNEFFQTFGAELNIGDKIIDKLPEPMQKEWMQYYTRALDNQRFTIENKIEFGNIKRYVQVSVNPIVSKEKIIGISFFGRDITQQKEKEIELILAKEKAQESDRLKSAFLANMSHEIRTPMNGILGFAELLKEPGLTGEEQQNYLRIIEKSGARMLNTINDIVDISKIEAGLIKLDLKKSNVNAQLEYIFTFFKPEAENKGIKLFIKKSLPAEEAIIQTDGEKLYAILTNLVKNAIKYTDKGSIEFGYRMVEKIHEFSLLEFYVKDTGIGIPSNRQAAIFERFVQADIEDTKARQGSGLGLAITKSYVEMLGGTIWLESEEGTGSTFYFTLPFHAEPSENKANPLPAQNASGDNAAIPEVSGLKILIAEDDETSEMFISILLKDFGKEVLKVRSGNEAVKICRKNPELDLILMDIQMPEMGGYEATRKIREFNKEVIIIAQTAFGLSGDREKAIEAGCNDYLSKPIKKEELHSLVKKYFRS